jgi:hypothetical protein
LAACALPNRLTKTNVPNARNLLVLKFISPLNR